MNKVDFTDEMIKAMPSSRGEATLMDAPYYFTNVPCKGGHIFPRNTKTACCVRCRRAQIAKNSRIRTKNRRHEKRITSTQFVGPVKKQHKKPQSKFTHPTPEVTGRRNYSAKQRREWIKFRHKRTFKPSPKYRGPVNNRTPEFPNYTPPPKFI